MSMEQPPPTYEIIIKNFQTTCQKLIDQTQKTQEINTALDKLLVYYCVFYAFYIVSINDVDVRDLSQQLIQAEQFIRKIKLQFPTIFPKVVQQSRKLHVIQPLLPSQVVGKQHIPHFVKDVNDTQPPKKQSKDILQSSYLYTAVKEKLTELDNPFLQLLLAAAFVQNVYTYEDESQSRLSLCISDYNSFGFEKLSKEYKSPESSTVSQPPRPNFPEYQILLNFLYSDSSSKTPQTPQPPIKTPQTPQTPQPPMNIIPALLGGASVLLAVVSTVFAN